MNWQKLVQGIVTASLIILLSEAVLSCNPDDPATSAAVHAESFAALRSYHSPAVLLGVGVVVFFLLRRFRGVLIVLLAVAALAISPGWFPMINAGIGPNCEPLNATEIKVVLGVVAVCFMAQLIFLIVERRRSNTR